MATRLLALCTPCSSRRCCMVLCLQVPHPHFGSPDQQPWFGWLLNSIVTSVLKMLPGGCHKIHVCISRACSLVTDLLFPLDCADGTGTARTRVRPVAGWRAAAIAITRTSMASLPPNVRAASKPFPQYRWLQELLQHLPRHIWNSSWITRPASTEL